MPNTTYLTLPYPSLSNAPNVPQDMQNLAAGVDNKLAGPIICTSSTRPAVRDGALIYETDTKRYMSYSSAIADWTVMGSNEKTFVRKSSNQTSTTNTLAADSALTVPVQANSTYRVELVLNYSGVSAADIKVLLRLPTAATFSGFGTILIPTAVSQQELQAAPYAGNASEIWGIIGTQWGRVDGLLVTAGNAGNLSVEWAQNTVNATATTVLAGSWLQTERRS